MRELLATGISAAEAAARRSLSRRGAAPSPAGVPVELSEALRRLDDAAAHAAFDRLLAELVARRRARRRSAALLRELGEGWEKGEVRSPRSTSHRDLVRGRLLGLARGWDRGAGPRAVLACPPEERHDLGLLIFGLALREHGWRITFLGGDTPVETLAETVDRLAPDAVVLAATQAARFDAVAEQVRGLAGRTTIWLAGSGAGADSAKHAGAGLLDLPPVAAAALVAAEPPG